jgi:molybdopterin-dependent oxidoreductase alpha subunit
MKKPAPLHTELDTVAQKPTHIGSGVATTPTAIGAADITPAPGAEPPVEPGGTRIEKRCEVAAGLPGVVQTAKFTWKEMGIARGARTLLKLNQKHGFDCQSCAWPSPDDDRHAFEFCENGVKAAADEATTKRITPDFFKAHSVVDLAGESDYWLGQQGRLTQPMILRDGATHYESVTWDEAFACIAAELNALSSPNEAAFYTSGRTSNEAAFLYQLFARQFGTNNLPDCSNMCHESSGAALNETIGIGKGCVRLHDFEKADAIFIIGQNPGTNHPRMLTTLAAAKARGCTIVSVNPLPEVGNFRFKNPQDFKNPRRALPALLGKGTSLSDLWLPVRINGDLALFSGIMKEMLSAEERQPGTVFDLAFIRDHTTGFDPFIESLRQTSWEEIVESSGVTRAQIHEAAAIAMRSKRIICCWAMGLTQHKNAVATIQAVMNFLLLGGHIGRPGAGPCPVRGHSNVQGDRTMGIWERMNDDFLNRLGAEFGFAPPRDHGTDTVETLKAMRDGRIQVFFGLGGNFLSATPDTNFTAHALRRCRLTAHVSTKLNRAHLITGRTALILPCLGRSEIDRQAAGAQFVTVEDSMGIINSSRGHLEPASEQLLSEPAIIARLARATLHERTTVDWESLAGNYDFIRDHIERVIPGFENYNERIRRGIFYLPNPARDKREFNNREGRAKFTVHPIPPDPLAPGQFLMMTMRSHDQFNTTIYGLDDRYRGIFNGRRVVFLNPEDIAAAGLQQGQLVDLTSHFEGVTRIAREFVVAPYSIPRRCAATYFPEANVLVPVNSVAERSNTPTSKSVIITIAPSIASSDSSASFASTSHQASTTPP